jgi:hypothetical protein
LARSHPATRQTPLWVIALLLCNADRVESILWGYRIASDHLDKKKISSGIIGFFASFGEP